MIQASMLGLSKKLIFSIGAVLDIAYNAGAQPVQGREFAARQQIPRRYLEPVLQELVRAHILEGVRGPRGGYRLARERRKITLAQIVEAVRSTELREDATDLPTTESALGQRIVAPMCRELVSGWMKQLDSITIEDLCNRARDAGIEGAAEKTHDFSI
jgi:Rrf2 family protein